MNIPFTVTDWSKIPATNHPGETGNALWKTLNYGDLRIREVEYSANYRADHWCEKGHILYCLEGEMISELSDGTSFILKAGMSYQVSDGLSSHRSVSENGVKLLIVDGGFLKYMHMVEILNYQQEHQPWFENLNRTWIEKHFWMEPVDFEVLQHPDKHIIDKGGEILMVSLNKEIVGTVALKYVQPGVYEFTKMAVDEKFQAKGLGNELALAAIGKAKKLGASKIILYSNTKLAPAIKLYRRLGFVEVPLDGPYKRSDIKMELSLTNL